jgi:hypothetical protein
MIRVARTEASESSRIVTHNRRAHVFRDSQLPRIIFTDVPGAALLAKRDTFSMRSMYALP